MNVNMQQLPQLLALLRTRNALIIIAVLLVLLNVGRLATNQYQDFAKGIESKQALLGQYKVSTKHIETMRTRIKALEQKTKKIDSYLFEGDSQREITSAMQIKIQELLGKAQLRPESLRPSSNSRNRKKDKEKLFGDISIKIRLSGNLDNFVQFLSDLYRLNYLFKVENFTLKPYKNDTLKIFLELKGFYKLSPETSEEKKRTR